jgi:hypothetical protein
MEVPSIIVMLSSEGLVTASINLSQIPAIVHRLKRL